MKTTLLSVLITTAILVAGCSNSLIHSRVISSTAAPEGIRWTESRPYDVYVFKGGAPAIVDSDRPGQTIITNGEPIQLYVGTHDLLDRVNGKVIDTNRSTWEVNYSAMPFASGGLELTFGDDGTIKTIKATGQPGASGALNAATLAVKTKDDVKSEELSDLKRETDILKAKADLIKAKSDLEKAQNP
jgi:hypothetical protein